MRNVARMVMVVVGLQLSLTSSLWAFAVGDITVHSRRGQPFAAEVRLLLEPREWDKEVEVTVGNQEAYRTEGLRRTAVIDTLQAVVPARARDIIRLSSSGPIEESAFDLVLSVRTGQVTIVKHYSVTLPAAAPASAQVLIPLPTIAPMAPVVQTAKASAKASARPARPPRRTERYGPIERGETLYSIARAQHIPNDKLWQGVVSIWRANKAQFVGGNLHGLQIGTFLEMPADLAENIAALRLAEAQEIVAQQWEEWQSLQRLGPGKQRIIAARDPEANTAPAGKRDPATTATAKREAAAPPAAPPAEKPPAPQAVVLPVGKHGNLVSMSELQTVLQGLEERLMRRLTPTAQAQEIKSPTALINSAELQASIQNLEERLTQRMQQMLIQVQTPEPVRVGQRPPPPAPPVSQAPTLVEAAQPVSLLMVPYLLVLTNVLFLLLIGALLWLWVRRRERPERLQRL